MRIDVDGNALSFESAALTDHMRRVVEAHRQPSPSSAAHAGSESSVAISPPPSRVRRRLDYNFMRSKEVKKSGEPVPGVRRATGAVRGREAAAQQLGAAGKAAGLVRALAPPQRACGVDPQSVRSLPRAAAASRALSTRRAAGIREDRGWRRIAVISVMRPRDTALARGPRGRTRLVVTDMTQLSYVFLAVLFSPRG